MGTIFKWPLDVSSSALAKYRDISEFRKSLFLDTDWKSAVTGNTWRQSNRLPRFACTGLIPQAQLSAWVLGTGILWVTRWRSYLRLGEYLWV